MRIFSARVASFSTKCPSHLRRGLDKQTVLSGPTRCGDCGPQSDMFAAGCLFFAMAARNLPYEDEELWSDHEVPPLLGSEEADGAHSELLHGLRRWEASRRPTAEAALNFLRAE